MARRKVKKQRLVNTQRRRKFLTFTRVVRYGLRNFTRNAWLTVAATVVMVITLLIIFITAVASSVLNEAIVNQKDKMDISIYLKAKIDDDALRNLAGKVRMQPNVISVTTSNSDQEYDKAVEENKNNKAYMDGLQLVAENGVDMNLPAVIHVKLQDYNKRSDLEKYVKNDVQFQEWVDNSRERSSTTEARQKTVEKLSSIMNYASKAGVVAGVIFVIISVLIIFNTIRMTIFSRRGEISMMKAIGADRYFIRGPFLIEAELYGIIAAIIAMVLGYLAMVNILPSLSSYMEITNTRSFVDTWWWAILLVMMTVGFIIGDLSARLALHRYLKNTDY